MKLSIYQILLLLFRLIFLLGMMSGLYAFGTVSFMEASSPWHFLEQLQVGNLVVSTSQLKILIGVAFLVWMGVWYWFGTLVERKLHVHLFPKWHLRAFYQAKPRLNLLKVIARRQKQPK